jgi:hypothetical protein
MATAMPNLGLHERPPSSTPRAPRRAHDPRIVLASVLASLVMAMLVAAAGVALDDPCGGGCSTADDLSYLSSGDDWCKFLNGKMFCYGEPN